MSPASPHGQSPAAETQSPIEIDPAAQPPPLEWEAIFGNRHPVELEIGCGKGKFLAAVAAARPTTNYLGVERAGKYYRKAVTRIGGAGLRHARLLRADGLDLLDRWVAPRSVQRIHIYFPDPWPKKRHHKRRIFRPALLALAARALPPGGEFRLATDHAEYGAIIRQLFEEQGDLFAPLPWPTDESARIPTSYSEKWRRAGRTLWWACYERRATPAPADAGRSRLDTSARDATFRSGSGPSD